MRNQGKTHTRCSDCENFKVIFTSLSGKDDIGYCAGGPGKSGLNQFFMARGVIVPLCPSFKARDV